MEDLNIRFEYEGYKVSDFDEVNGHVTLFIDPNQDKLTEDSPLMSCFRNASEHAGYYNGTDWNPDTIADDVATVTNVDFRETVLDDIAEAIVDSAMWENHGYSFEVRWHRAFEQMTADTAKYIWSKEAQLV